MMSFSTHRDDADTVKVVLMVVVVVVVSGCSMVHPSQHRPFRLATTGFHRTCAGIVPTPTLCMQDWTDAAVCPRPIHAASSTESCTL